MGACRQLTHDQLRAFERDGVLVVPSVVPRDKREAVRSAVAAFAGLHADHPDGWHRWGDRSVYDDPPDVSGREGFVQLFHHASLWAIRQDPQVVSIFQDVLDTEALYVNSDRVSFLPPTAEGEALPHSLHFDVDLRPAARCPHVPLVVQGLVYLTDTPAERGALEVARGFHHKVAAHIASHPTEDPAATLLDGAVVEPVPGRAGDLVLWNAMIPHKPGTNVSAAPREAVYLSYSPVQDNAAHSPYGLADAGTTAYESVFRGSDMDAPPPPRLTRASRVERWAQRLPLLAEDPREDALPVRPPGEEDGTPCALTALGRRLVGLDDWP